MKRTFAIRRDVDHGAIDRGWRRVRAARERGSSPRRLAILVPLVAVAAILLFLFGRAPTPAIEVASPALLALADGTSLPELISTTQALGDGSKLELANASVLRTKKLESTRVELALEQGQTTFDIKPGGPRTWVIDAGNVTVRVLGTRFTVARSANGTHVSVERGKVAVEGPTVANGSRILTAGESLDVPISDAPPPVEVAKLVEPAPPPRPKASPLVESAAPSPAQSSEPSIDPMTRADDARRDGRPRDAAALLEAMVDRKDARASLAAFTLGKIYAGDLGDARKGAVWFERALALKLPSGLDEQAIARTVECHAKSGSRAEAAAAAARYEALFPRGPHLENVRAWASGD